MDMSTRPATIDANEAFVHRPEADSFDLKGTWHTIVSACRHRLRLIVATAAVTVALVLAYIVIWPPVYVAQVTVVSASEKDPQRDQFYSDWAVFRRDELNSEVQLFTSGPVLAEVIHRLNLHYDDVYHPPLGYAAHLWTVSWPGRAWRAVKEWIVPPPADAPTAAERDFAQTLDDLRSGVTVQQVASSNVGKLTVRAPSPRAKQIADTVVDVYLKQRRLRFAREAQEAYDALNVEANRTHAQLVELETRMQRYFTDNDMSLMFEKDKVEIAQLLAQRGGISETETQIAQMRGELATIRGQLAREPVEVTASRVIQANPIRQSFRDRLAQLQLARRTLLIRYLPTSPEVRDVDRQIAAVSAQIGTEDAQSVQQTSVVRSAAFDQLRQRAEALQGQIAGAIQALAVKRRDAGTLSRTVDLIPAKMKESHDLGREHDALEKKYLAIRDKLMIAGVSVATAKSAPPSIQVVEYAAVPDKPAMPMTRLFLLAAVVLGLLAGVALAVLMDQLQGVVNRPRLLRRRGGVPLYGVVHQDADYARQIYGV